MLLSPSVGSILLASSFLFSGALGEGEEKEREIIGYRTAHVNDAMKMNEHKKPYRDERFDNDSYRNQLGHGFYMTSEAASWPGDENEWYCTIKADSQKIKEARKVWIPEHRREINQGFVMWPIRLWYASEEDILDYIEPRVPENPEKALRFSYIQGVAEELQMVIPTAMINQNEFDFWAQCWETPDELLEFSSESVPWTEKWEIAGDPGPAVEEDITVSQILAEMNLGIGPEE